MFKDYCFNNKMPTKTPRKNKTATKQSTEEVNNEQIPVVSQVEIAKNTEIALSDDESSVVCEDENKVETDDEVNDSPSDVDILTLKKFEDSAHLSLYLDAVIQELSDVTNGITKNKETASLLKSLKLFGTRMRTVKKNLTTICKKKKKSRGSGGNANSGFLRPVGISDEMRKFAGWPKGEVHSRVDVTKNICEYIASNGLQNPEDKRQIIPDTKLKKLLGIKGVIKDPIYYYNIQTYIKRHFSPLVN